MRIASEDQDNQRISDYLVRLVQVFFALVLAQSLFLFREVILDPTAQHHWTAVLALLTVFYTTVASWIDWHVTMIRRPYNTRLRSERVRVYMDVAVAVFYAYLLFTIEPFQEHSANYIGRHLFGYFLVFAAYIGSGVLRRTTHGAAASRLDLLVWFGALYAVLYALYREAWLRASSQPPSYALPLNVGAVVLALLLMISYRAVRQGRARRKEAGLFVGIDLDGVLADQIFGVLPIVNRKFGLNLTRADVTEWRLPVGNSDIALEIVSAQNNRAFVAGMPAHKGAVEFTKYIFDSHRIAVVTVRKSDPAWTRAWLDERNIRFDLVIAADEAKKSAHATDILIDDYIGNIAEFLTNAPGIAVLVNQPWNQDRVMLKPFVDKKRLFVVEDLDQLKHIWSEVEKAAREEAAQTT